MRKAKIANSHGSGFCSSKFNAICEQTWRNRSHLLWVFRCNSHMTLIDEHVTDISSCLVIWTIARRAVKKAFWNRREEMTDWRVISDCVVKLQMFRELPQFLECFFTRVAKNSMPKLCRNNLAHKFHLDADRNNEQLSCHTYLQCHEVHSYNPLHRMIFVSCSIPQFQITF